MKLITVLKRFFTILLLCFLSIIVKSQGNPGDLDPGGTPTGWVPIDGGIAALLAVGVGYGAKKAYEYRSKRQTNSSNKMD